MLTVKAKYKRMSVPMYAFILIVDRNMLLNDNENPAQAFITIRLQWDCHQINKDYLFLQHVSDNRIYIRSLADALNEK